MLLDPDERLRLRICPLSLKQAYNTNLALQYIRRIRTTSLQSATFQIRPIQCHARLVQQWIPKVELPTAFGLCDVPIISYVAAIKRLEQMLPCGCVAIQSALPVLRFGLQSTLFLSDGIITGLGRLFDSNGCTEGLGFERLGEDAWSDGPFW